MVKDYTTVHPLKLQYVACYAVLHKCFLVSVTYMYLAETLSVSPYYHMLCL